MESYGGNKRSNDEKESSIPVHSQVMKIKKEIEKIKYPSLQQPEMRRLLLRAVNRQRSRSPLGLAQRDRERTISVGN